MSMTRGGWRGILAAAGGGIAVVLAVASVAAACTSYKGWLKVCDGTDTDGSQAGVFCVQANASGSGMNNTLVNTGTGTNTNPDIVSGPTATRGTEDLTVSVGPLAGGNQLPTRDSTNNSSYRIMFWDGQAYDTMAGVTDATTSRNHARKDCMSDRVNELPLPLFGAVLKQLDLMEVNSAGNGSKVVTIPSDARTSASVGGQAALCVVDKAANYGNQVPLLVV